MTTPEQPTGETPERPKRTTKKQLPEPPVDTDQLAKSVAGSGRTKTERIEETHAETLSRLRIREENAKTKRAEKDAAIAENKAAMDHRRRVEIISLLAYLAVSVVVVIACLVAVFDKGTAPQDKAWVAPTLTLIVGGIAGFVSGRHVGQSVEK